MSTRRAKQIIYGVMYVVLWVVLIGVIWLGVELLSPSAPVAPPCTSACVPVGVADIATSTVQAFASTPGHYTFLVGIADTDADYAASYLDYAIDLYDASGTVLQSIPGSSFVYAGQSKYLVVPNAQVAEPFVTAGISVTDAYWAASSTLGSLPQFSVENVTVGGTSSTVAVSGQLTNGNLASTRYVFVDVIFKGQDGSPIGASQTELDGVAAGQTVNFSVIYPQTGAINPSASAVLVYGLK